MKVGDNYYRATKILGRTGVTEPADGWGVPLNPPAEIDTDIITQDGSIYWKCFKRLNVPATSISQRYPSSSYGIGDYMYLQQYPDYMFKCVDLARISGGTAPDTTGHDIGDFIVDGGIVWVVKEYINDDNTGTWSSLTQYQLGQTINSIGNYSLECVSYTGSTSSTETENINFEQTRYGVVSQDSETSSFYVEGNVGDYFKKDDVIYGIYYRGSTEFRTTFAVNATVYPVYNDEVACTQIVVTRFQDGAETEVAIEDDKVYKELEVSRKGTFDGEIQWTLIEDVNEITYDWNSYVTFNHELKILED